MTNNISQFEPIMIDEMAKAEEAIINKYLKRARIDYQTAFEIKQEELIDRFLRVNWFCHTCDKKLYKHTSTPVTVTTQFGKVKLSLKRFRCPDCKQTFTPARRLVPNNLISANLTEMICDICSRISFEQSSEIIERCLGLNISPTKLHKIVDNESNNMIDLVQRDAKNLFTDGLDIPNRITIDPNTTIIIGLDGCWYHKYKQEGNQEAKTINISTGVTIKNGRRVLTGRQGYSANVNLEEFKQLAYTFALQNGLESAKNVIVVSDGEKAITNLVEEIFPSAIHLLDFFHLKMKINNLFGHGKLPLYIHNLHKEAIRAVDDINPERLLTIIRKYNPKAENKIKQKEELLTYIELNEKQILNHLGMDIHGSGQIEKGCDLLVARRLKLRAMGWTVKGSNSILKFRIMHYNKNWDQYWNKRKGKLKLAA